MSCVCVCLTTHQKSTDKKNKINKRHLFCHFIEENLSQIILSSVLLDYLEELITQNWIDCSTISENVWAMRRSNNYLFGPPLFIKINNRRQCLTGSIDRLFKNLQQHYNSYCAFCYRSEWISNMYNHYQLIVQICITNMHNNNNVCIAFQFCFILKVVNTNTWKEKLSNQ